jgi:four helix bundle protein
MDETQTVHYLGCERLDAYRVALELHRELLPLARGRELYSLRDQLLRAAESVVLNIAEGSARVSPADKRRFYAIAAGSAMEVGACLELLRNRAALSPASYHHNRSLVIRLQRVLSRLAGPPRRH